MSAPMFYLVDWQWTLVNNELYFVYFATHDGYLNSEAKNTKALVITNEGLPTWWSGAESNRAVDTLLKNRCE
jgi:hypothetical protein